MGPIGPPGERGFPGAEGELVIDYKNDVFFIFFFYN